MIQFVCSCLNIRIHAKGILPELENPRNFSLPAEVICDPFFESHVYQIVLDLAGVTVSQKGLCKSRHIENWIVTSCACCMMDMFAKRIDDHVSAYVSSKSETRTNYITSLLESECYSSLFKIVLPEINDNFIQNNIGIEFQNGNIDHSIELVQNQVSSYLEDEQKAMDERIRLFTEEQHSNYALLLKKVRKHKQAMIYLMIKNKESQNKSIEESVTSSTSPSALNQDFATESSSSTDSAFIRSNSSDHPGREALHLKKSQSLKGSKIKNEGKKSTSIDITDDIDFPPQGCLFDMEEFDSKDVFSSNSDDDPDELEVDVSTDVTSDIPDSQLMCASSLPVSIPSFSRRSYVPLPEEDEKDNVPIDIAASMRALACSVQDGTEMFGELPRRRLNTGELLAFRPF